MTLSDIKGMSLGQVIDFVLEYNERNKQSEADSKGKAKVRKRRATQSDIDAWLG